MGDPHAIDDLAALRRIIGEPIPDSARRTRT
jgi:hypothetical protein